MARSQKYQSPTQQLSIRIPAHLLAAIDVEARTKNRPRAEIVVSIFDDYYSRHRPEKPSVFA